MKINKFKDWDEYYKLSIKERCSYLRTEDRLFDILFSQQFDKVFLDRLYSLTNKIRLISKTNHGATWLSLLLSSKKAMLYFAQPSTRTYLSFVAACQNLGIRTADVRSVETSSEVKGESQEDTIRTFSSYFDFIIMRYPDPGFVEKAAFVLNRSRRPIPILNAGSGKDQHPTQALLDWFTLRKSLDKQGGISNKTILFVGDLKRGRTVRSLCYLLRFFEGVRIIFCAPDNFQIEPDITRFLERKNIDFTLGSNLKQFLPMADAIYMTRLQKEYDEKKESLVYNTDNFSLNSNTIQLVKSSCVIMHPLPRNNEISNDIEGDRRIVFWRQVRNGMWTRTALIAHLFGLNDVIMNK